MPDLHVRNVPEETYSRLRCRAEQHHRSISAEIIAMLSEVEEIEPAAMRFDTFLEIADHIRQASPLPPGAQSSAELLREERMLPGIGPA